MSAQDATFESSLNAGVGTLQRSTDATAESLLNLGAGILPRSKDATIESFKNLGAGAMEQKITQLPRGWGVTSHTNVVTVIGDPDATSDNMTNIV